MRLRFYEQPIISIIAYKPVDALVLSFCPPQPLPQAGGSITDNRPPARWRGETSTKHTPAGGRGAGMCNIVPLPLAGGVRGGVFLDAAAPLCRGWPTQPLRYIRTHPHW